MSGPARPPLVDPRGRAVDYLRLSITDLCDLRCTYCMPAEGVPKLAHGEILTLEELLEAARAAIALGVTKVRVTGGEPLVRRGVLWLLRELAATPGLATLALTTNGTRLAELACDLAAAGVRRVNVSLDALTPELYARITRGGDVARVVAGIDAALAAGLPVKLNAVLLAGANAAEIPLLAAFARERRVGLRFIELMPFERDLATLAEAEALAALRAERFAAEPLPADPREPHVRRFAYRGAVVGFISPISHAFCAGCNKIRLTPAGALKPCLAADAAIDLRAVLRGPHTARDVERAIAAAVARKPAAAPWSAPAEMWKVGG